MSKTYDEQLAELEKQRQRQQEKMDRIRARERQVRARRSQQERKARTRRLIQVGAVLETGLGTELATEEEREALSRVLAKPREGGGTLGEWIASLTRKETETTRAAKADAGEE